MRIVACLDGSEYAEAVLPVADEVASAPDDEVELLRIISPSAVEKRLPPPPDRGASDLIEASGINPAPEIRRARERQEAYEAEMVRLRDRLRRELEAEARRELEAAAADLSAETRVTVVFGRKVADTIVEHARQNAASIVAMATHSRGPLPELLMGSTARDVLKSGEVPVLLVHPKKK